MKQAHHVLTIQHENILEKTAILQYFHTGTHHLIHTHPYFKGDPINLLLLEGHEVQTYIWKWIEECLKESIGDDTRIRIIRSRFSYSLYPGPDSARIDLLTLPVPDEPAGE